MTSTYSNLAFVLLLLYYGLTMGREAGETEIRLAFDVAPQEIAERISGSKITEDEEPGITAISIGGSLSKILYWSINPRLLIVFPEVAATTVPLALGLNETAVVMEKDRVRYVTRIRQDSSGQRLPEDTVILCVIEPRRIAYVVQPISECDQLTQKAIQFIESGNDYRTALR